MTNLEIPSNASAAIPVALKSKSSQFCPALVFRAETLTAVANAVLLIASKSPAARAVFDAGLDAVTPKA